jgi:uncharacterized membrane protein YccC
MLIFHNVLIAVAIASAVLAYVVYRRWKGKSQRLDPLSELRAEQESLRAAIEALPAQLDFAKRSRTAAEAAGLLRSEAMQQWLSELDIDLLEVKLLESHLPAADTEYADLSDMELDIRLVEILGLSLRADILADKYRAPLSAHDRDRESPIDHAGSLSEPAGVLSEPAGVRHSSLSLIAPS